jgi:hypothetical protein
MKGSTLTVVALRVNIALGRWMVLLFTTVGHAALWYGSITTLQNQGGFLGLIGWQGPGIVLLVMRDVFLWRQYTRPGMERGDRWRFGAQLLVVGSCTIANLVTILLMVYHLLVTERLEWYWTDTFVLIASFCVLMWACGDGRKAVPSFRTIVLVGGTRAFPQTLLVFSPDIGGVSFNIVGGLVLVAFAQLALNFMEYQNINALDHEGKRNQFQLLVAETMNASSALLLLTAWSAVAFL